MRISTGMIYDQGVSGLQQQSAALLHTNAQIASGRRILTPATDPVAAARVLDLRQSESVNRQFMSNQGAAEDALRMVEGQLSGAVDILQYVRDRALEANNAALGPGELKLIAADIRAQYDALLAVGNSRDANGDYLFSGYKSNTRPFEGNPDNPLGATYSGDQGSRTMQVSSSRFMPISFAGDQIFAGGDQDVFRTLANFVSALESGSDVSDTVTTTIDSIDVNLDNVLRVIAQTGTQRMELEQLANVGSDLDLQYRTTIGRLEDLDYNEATSRLAQQRLVLEAAQQSFIRVSGLSLFNYMS